MKFLVFNIVLILIVGCSSDKSEVYKLDIAKDDKSNQNVDPRLYYVNKSLQIKERAGEDYKSVGNVNRGDSVFIFETVGDWSRIIFDGRISGYLPNRYISKEKGNYGYRDFKWGLAVSDVRNKVTNLKQIRDNSIQPLWDAFTYQYLDLFHGTVRDPSNKLVGKVEVYKSNEDKVQFYFIDGQLFCVEIEFGLEEVYSGLINFFGEGNLRRFTRDGHIYEINVWFNDPGRIIVYSSFRFMGSGYNYVSYIDRLKYESIIQELVEERERELDELGHRLD